jgi:hypothetical protein
MLRVARPSVRWRHIDALLLRRYRGIVTLSRHTGRAQYSFNGDSDMPAKASRAPDLARAFRSYLGAVLILLALGSGSVAFAQGGSAYFLPNNLLLSRVVYDNNPKNVVVGMSLPPECVPADCVLATANGSYPQVFNNALVDSSFGITAKIILDQLTTSGTSISRSICRRTVSPSRSWATWRRSTPSTCPTPTPQASSIRRTRFPGKTLASWPR